MDFLSNALYMFGSSAQGKGDQTQVGFIFDCARLVKFYEVNVFFFIMVGLLFGLLGGFILGQVFAYLFHI